MILKVKSVDVQAAICPPRLPGFRRKSQRTVPIHSPRAHELIPADASDVKQTSGRDRDSKPSALRASQCFELVFRPGKIPNPRRPLRTRCVSYRLDDSAPCLPPATSTTARSVIRTRSHEIPLANARRVQRTTPIGMAGTSLVFVRPHSDFDDPGQHREAAGRPICGRSGGSGNANGSERESDACPPSRRSRKPSKHRSVVDRRICGAASARPSGYLSSKISIYRGPTALLLMLRKDTQMREPWMR